MKIVSDDFKKTLAMPFRPQSKAKISLDMTLPEAEDASVTLQQKAPFSTGIFDSEHDGDYITFEPDFFQLGRGQKIASISHIKNGFVSSSMTDSEGVFTNIPTIDVTFDETQSFAGMTYHFVKDFPTEMVVTAYLGGTPTEYTLEPTSLEYVDTTHIDCDRIVVEFTKMHEPYRRLRLARMWFGFIKIFGMDEIISTNHTIFVDPISSTLSNTKFAWTIKNFDKAYNPDNKQGVWSYFKNGQPLSIEYGVQVPSGYEWVKSGKLLLSNAPKVTGTQVSFEASDLLTMWDGIYEKGVYNSNGNLYDLALDVLADMGVTDYSIPIALQNVKTTAPLPMVSHKECLQIIANAGRCVLFVDNTGRVRMEVQIDAKVTVSDNGHTEWSSAQQAYEGVINQIDYITFEPNKWKIGNPLNVILPEENPHFVGFVSSAIANASGTFSENPVITVNYSLPVSTYMFTLDFDRINGDAPSDFDIRFSNGETIEVRNNTETEYILNRELINITSVEIEFIKTAPYHRVKVEAIDKGRVTDFYLDYSKALAKPTLTQNEELKAVEVKCHSYTFEPSGELYNETVELHGTVEWVVDYDASKDVSVSVTGGTLNSSVVYARRALLNITANGNVTITVSGKKLIDGVTTVVITNSNTGNICPLDNPLITNTGVAKDVGEWIKNFCKNRSTYELPFRQDFHLDANDAIYMKTEFDEWATARITKLNFKLSGQTGNVTLRRLS